MFVWVFESSSDTKSILRTLSFNQTLEYIYLQLNIPFPQVAVYTQNCFGTLHWVCTMSRPINPWRLIKSKNLQIKVLKSCCQNLENSPTQSDAIHLTECLDEFKCKSEIKLICYCKLLRTDTYVLEHVNEYKCLYQVYCSFSQCRDIMICFAHFCIYSPIPEEYTHGYYDRLKSIWSQKLLWQV